MGGMHGNNDKVCVHLKSKINFIFNYTYIKKNQ